MIHQFAEVPDFPDYLVTLDGRVWSKKSRKFLSNEIVTGRESIYFRLTLYNDTGKKKIYVQRLMALTFRQLIPYYTIKNGQAYWGKKSLGKMQVEHLDGDSFNNCINNLCVVTARTNARLRSKRNDSKD